MGFFTENFLKVAIILIVFSFGMFCGQLQQFLNSYKDIGGYFVKEWVGDDQNRNNKLKIFNDECVNPDPITNKRRARTMENECAKKHGVEDVYIITKKPDSVIKTFSFPLSSLSLLISEKKDDK